MRDTKIFLYSSSPQISSAPSVTIIKKVGVNISLVELSGPENFKKLHACLGLDIVHTVSLEILRDRSAAQIFVFWIFYNVFANISWMTFSSSVSFALLAFVAWLAKGIKQVKMYRKNFMLKCSFLFVLSQLWFWLNQIHGAYFELKNLFPNSMRLD